MHLPEKAAQQIVKLCISATAPIIRRIPWRVVSVPSGKAFSMDFHVDGADVAFAQDANFPTTSTTQTEQISQRNHQQTSPIWPLSLYKLDEGRERNQHQPTPRADRFLAAGHTAWRWHPESLRRELLLKKREMLTNYCKCWMADKNFAVFGRDWRFVTIGVYATLPLILIEDFKWINWRFQMN